MFRSPALHRVLWIDDDAIGVELAARLAIEAGVAVDIAQSGEEGLARARATAYSLILLDLRLPDTSGLDVLKSMASNGVRSPIVLVTGFASLPAAVEAVRLGAVDVRSKPFFGDELFPLLDTYGSPLAARNPWSDDHNGGRERLRLLAELAVSHPTMGLACTARRVGVDRHALQRQVRRQTGLCWRDWRRKIVMGNAAHIVGSTDIPLKALTERFGYSSVQAFSRAFREVWGVSPGRYRQTRRS